MAGFAQAIFDVDLPFRVAGKRCEDASHSKALRANQKLPIKTKFVRREGGDLFAG